jgi:thermolabile hemolysin
LQYTSVVTFGDSTTDSGTAYQLSNHTWPPVPPFNSNGGFADDLLWNQIFAQKFLSHATLQNFACGSATTDSRLAQGVMSRNPNLIANYTIRNNTKSPGVRQQIAQYINSTNNKTIDFDRILYVIWAGTNNYFFNKTLTTLDTVQSIIDCLNLLIIFGGRHFAIINEPPFDRFPAFRNKSETNATKQLYVDHNTILATQFNENYSPSTSRLHIRLFDSYSFISNIMENYTNYGFENLDSCWDTITNSTVQVLCQNITKRMFCDEYHFTSQMQSFIAEEFYHVMTEGLNSTLYPETTSAPSSITSKIAINLGFIIIVLINTFLLK